MFFFFSILKWSRLASPDCSQTGNVIYTTQLNVDDSEPHVVFLAEALHPARLSCLAPRSSLLAPPPDCPRPPSPAQCLIIWLPLHRFYRQLVPVYEVAGSQLSHLLCFFFPVNFTPIFKRNFWEKARERDFGGQVIPSWFSYRLYLSALLNEYVTLFR